LRIAFAASSAFAFLAFLFSLAHRTGSLERKCGREDGEDEAVDAKDDLER
jgi:hypothetical protein